MPYESEIYNSVLDRVEEILERCKLQIQDEMRAKDINASGATSDSFRVERYAGGIRLVMGGTERRTAPLETLEIGRPAGNVPGGFRTTKAGVRDVSNTFKWLLIQWAKEKGIADFGWGRATMLGRRIADEGTLRHKAPVNVYSQAVVDARAEIGEAIEMTITTKIHEQLLKDWRQ